MGLGYKILFYPRFEIFLVLQLLVLQPGIVRQEAEAPSLKALLMDPYIIVAAGREQKIGLT
jgi:hypothetical protein